MNKKDRQYYFEEFLIGNYLFNIYKPEEVKRLKKKHGYDLDE